MAKRLTPQEQFTVGQHVNVNILKSAHGTNLIGREDKSGIICKLDLRKSVVIEAGCTALCKVIEIFDNKLKVNVVEVIVSAATNNAKFTESLAKLKELSNKEYTVKQKVKKHYPFLSKAEHSK
jgi:hypothetical protein